MASEPNPVMAALLAARDRRLMPTELDTRGLRKLGAKLLRNAVFVANGTSTIYLSKLKEVIDAIAAGDMDDATARWMLIEVLDAMGYTPEGGFPDAPPGAVPPAMEGSLQDLRSFRRMDLIIRTQRDLVRGAGQQMRGHSGHRLTLFPAWELIRTGTVKVARDWPARWAISGGKPPGEAFAKNAHQVIGGSTGMIALKGDPVWGELGSYDNFPDALGVDHAPFCFNSEMGLREVPISRCKELGILGPDGQSIEDWQASRPPVMAGNLPAPQLDVNRVDPELLQKLGERDGVAIIDGKVTTEENKEKLRAQIAARRAAREARRSALLEKSVSERKAEYEKR